MRQFTWAAFTFGTIVTAATAFAQPPEGDRRPDAPGRPGTSNRGAAGNFVSRMLKLDTNNDQQLSREEVSDPRLKALFERADGDKDGIVTKRELTALYEKESPALRQGDRGRPGEGRRGRPGDRPEGGPRDGAGRRDGAGSRDGDRPHDGDRTRDGDRARDGDRPRRGPEGRPGDSRPQPPKPGQILPPHLQRALRLTDRQQSDLEQLQADVDTRLKKILTDDQQRQLRELHDRRPGGRDGEPRGAGPRDRGPEARDGRGGPPGAGDRRPGGEGDAGRKEGETRRPRDGVRRRGPENPERSSGERRPPREDRQPEKDPT